MQDSPTKEALLLAIARFLEREVRPLMTDPRVNFRLLVASSLAQMVALECDGEDSQDAAEAGRLAALLGEEMPPAGRAERRAWLRASNERLAADLRVGRLEGERLSLAYDHLKKTLAEKLAMNNPRFSTAPEIE